MASKSKAPRKNDSTHAGQEMENAELAQLLVENVKDYAIKILDPAAHILTWTPTAERLKGWKADEIIGQHFSKFYTPEDVASGKTDEELKMAVEHGRMGDVGWGGRN